MPWDSLNYCNPVALNEKRNQVAIDYTAIKLHYCRDKTLAHPLYKRNPMTQPDTHTPIETHSVLAWPAWWRVLAVLPALLLLWLAVLWASVEAAPL
jgi:hypothetical protein